MSKDASVGFLLNVLLSIGAHLILIFQCRLIKDESFDSAQPDTKNGSHIERIVPSVVEVSRSVFSTVKKLNLTTLILTGGAAYSIRRILSVNQTLIRLKNSAIIFHLVLKFSKVLIYFFLFQ
jgi:hypothetical protein